MVFDVHQRNVVLLVLVFKNRSSRGWAFVSLIGALLYSAYRFLTSRTDVVCPDRTPYILYVQEEEGVRIGRGVFEQYWSARQPVLLTRRTSTGN